MKSTKLNQANLTFLGPQIGTPRYDRRKVGQGIAHIGVGGFHRAHQTVYTEDLFLRGGDLAGDLAWGFCGIGLLAQDVRMRDVLRDQDHLYTLVERDGSGDRARIIGSIVNFLLHPMIAKR
jgi:mannitol 2-dehydrogenase